MAKTGLINSIIKIMLSERGAYSQLRETRESHQYRIYQTELCNTLSAIREQGDPGLIIAAEIELLANEREFYGNSAVMIGSLDAALHEAGVALANIARVRDSERYMREVEATHQLPGNRVGGLPRDETRQFFDSHHTRLMNMDKSRLDEAEKTVIEERRRNIKAGRLAYTTLQRRALGLAPDNGQ